VKIGIVNGICAQYDAISDSVRGMQQAIAHHYGVQPTLFCYACDFPMINHRIVNSPSDLLLDREFMDLDLIIYHFGIHYGLFDAIFFRQRAKKVVYYHNVTPAKLLPTSQRALIDRSMRQRANMTAADAIWAASRFNADDLVQCGIAPEMITVEPLFLKFRQPSLSTRYQAGDAVELLFVGRFVESKGVADLIDAVAEVRRQQIAPVRLSMAGNQTFSDPAFIAALNDQIAHHDLAEFVSFEGQVSDVRLAELYANADLFVLPSYHEGFCVPVIEALHNRCVPLTYDAGNLAHLVGAWGVAVPTGDRVAYANALADLVRQFANGRPGSLELRGCTLSWPEFENGAADHLKAFTFEAFADRTIDGIRRLLGSRGEVVA
jgi:glycosyltransferase involved in cell wall biosynthesis